MKSITTNPRIKSNRLSSGEGWGGAFPRRCSTACVILAAILPTNTYALQLPNIPPYFTKTKSFNEETCIERFAPDVRIHVNQSVNKTPGLRTRLLIYATPNGNTIEQTLGCKPVDGLDWHYDIQHVAAQVRLLRSINPSERLVLACTEASALSWPAWRRAHERANATMFELVHAWRKRFGGEDSVVTLAGHSGGGSFLFGVIEGGTEIPSWIDRIVFLDANYSFEEDLHAEKLHTWLVEDESRRLIVIAYDDRNIELQGKRVIGPDGGTFRATGRMRSAFDPHFQFSIDTRSRPFFTEYQALGNRIRLYIHGNPDNKILHTALVGEMNGLVYAQTLGTAAETKWGQFGGPRAYADWIQPLPSEPLPQLPPRPADGIGGREFMRRVERLSLEDREAIAYREITRGNFPQFLRKFHRVAISGTMSDGQRVDTAIEVMSDYLAIGSDVDFVRMPLRPQTAQKIADQFGCVLPTRKMVDTIDRHATVRLEPRPLTERREAAATFLQHHEIIEKQRAGHSLGALITGIKKDVVLSPRIFERPNRLAIYGWRKLDGQPIQNLTIVHVNHYVDYSHGIRLVRNAVEIDGQTVEITSLLKDKNRFALVSDEGPMDPPRYPMVESEQGR